MIIIEEERLLKRINSLRIELQKLIINKKYDLTNPQVVSLSQELDELISEFNESKKE